MKNSTFSWLARLFCTILPSPQNYIKRISAQPGVSERTAGTEQRSARHDLPSTTPFVLEGKMYIGVKHLGNKHKAEATFM